MWFRRKPDPPALHVHDFDIRQAHQRDIYAPGKSTATGNYPVRRYTTVLFACRGCHERFTKDLDGHWKLEDLIRIRQREKGFMEPWEGYETKNGGA